MAIFHATIKTFSRSKGHSATAAAAYRAGVRLIDERTGVAHDYTRKAGVVSANLFLPNDSPAWARDTSTLWNAAEAADARRNSRTARELEVALPAELDLGQRSDLAHALAQMLVHRYGVAVMAAIHKPGGGGDNRNHHVHLLFTTRTMTSKGFGAKVRVLDDQTTGPEEVATLRSLVSQQINQHLARAGCAERVDHRTLSEQAGAAAAQGDIDRVLRLTREPTRHEGMAATAARRRGMPSELGDSNTSVSNDNQILFSSFLQKAGQANRQITISKRSPRAVFPASRNLQSLIKSGARIQRGTGKSSEVVNAQAQLLEETLRSSQQITKDYADALSKVSDEVSALLRSYVAARSLPEEDAHVLARHCARDRRMPLLLREMSDARSRVDLQNVAIGKARRRYGSAMARSTRRDEAVEALETQRPSRWKPIRRREWAEVRRANRAKAAHAAAAESYAREAVRHATDAHRTGYAQAVDTLNTLESRRRELCSLPSDALVAPSKKRTSKQAKISPPRPSPRPGLRPH